VVGVDFSPIQPSWVPENVKFVVDNIEEDWLFDVGAGGDGFDLVHLRQMFPVLKGPERVLAQAFEHVFFPFSEALLECGRY